VADKINGPLIEAAKTAYDACMFAQHEAAKLGQTDALASLSVAREWIAITLRRLGVSTVPRE
jgi:hypothetical protein